MNYIIIVFLIRSLLLKKKFYRPFKKSYILSYVPIFPIYIVWYLKGDSSWISLKRLFRSNVVSETHGDPFYDVRHFTFLMLLTHSEPALQLAYFCRWIWRRSPFYCNFEIRTLKFYQAPTVYIWSRLDLVLRSFQINYC